MSKLYKKSGVDVVKTDQLIIQALKFIKSSHNKKVLGNKLGFSAEYKINKNITLCSATDGVGTKAILAAELGIYEGIGQDLVGMCSNDLLCNKAKPLFFLDYFACSSVITKQYTEILKSITKACKKIQCALIGGETAEMPSLYQKNHFDMAGFLVGLKLNQKRLRVKKNDLIMGVQSNGFHSNGYSLIRKIIKDNKINLTGELTIKDKSRNIPIDIDIIKLSSELVQVKSDVSFSRNDFDIGTGNWKNTTILKDEIKIKANIFLFKE